jgi:hypothetical protein
VSVCVRERERDRTHDHRPMMPRISEEERREKERERGREKEREIKQDTHSVSCFVSSSSTHNRCLCHYIFQRLADALCRSSL